MVMPQCFHTWLPENEGSSLVSLFISDELLATYEIVRPAGRYQGMENQIELIEIEDLTEFVTDETDETDGTDWGSYIYVRVGEFELSMPIEGDLSTVFRMVEQLRRSSSSLL